MSEVLTQLMRQAADGHADLATLRAIVEEAGEMGATRALTRAGLADEGARGEGRLALAEMAALFWHCVRERPDWLTRQALGEAIVEAGLAAASPVLRMLLGQILSGR